jgi:hypothetical protein
LNDLQRVVARLFLDDVEALVENPLGRAALAVVHDRVDELADERAAVQRIGGEFALGDFSSTWHDSTSLLLRALGAVLRPTLLAALDAHGVERAAHDVIAHAGQILDAAAADEHQRVLLQVVPTPGI